jgi:hypothetical protein
MRSGVLCYVKDAIALKRPRLPVELLNSLWPACELASSLVLAMSVEHAV